MFYILSYDNMAQYFVPTEKNTKYLFYWHTIRRGIVKDVIIAFYTDHLSIFPFAMCKII